MRGESVDLDWRGSDLAAEGPAMGRFSALCSSTKSWPPMTRRTIMKFTDRENTSVSISSAAKIYRAGLFCARVTRSGRIAHVLPTGSTPPTCTPAYAMARQLKDCHLRPPLTALLFTSVLNTDWKKRKIILSGRKSVTENPPNLRHRRREYPVTPTQLFNRPVRVCFHL